jgi:hypothetical protein
MNRGKILQYSGEHGFGRVVSNGSQFSFKIQQWKGSSAPTLNRIVEVEIRSGLLVSITEVPDSALLQEAAGETPEFLKKLGRQILNLWRLSVSATGRITVLAQIVYAISLFELPVASFQLLWYQESTSVYKLSSSPLIHMSGLYMWCLYASSVAILLPAFVRDRKSWLALLLPLFLLLIVACKVYLIIGEISAQSEQYGGLALGSLRQTIHVEVGFFTVVAPAIVLAVQGLRNFITNSRNSTSTPANYVL